MLVSYKYSHSMNSVCFLSENLLVPQGNGVKQGKDNFVIKCFATKSRRRFLAITCLLKLNVSMTALGCHAHDLAVLFSSFTNISDCI